MITLADLKATLRIEGTNEDAYLTALEAAAVAHIEQVTNRHFGPLASVTEYLPGSGCAELWLREPPSSLPATVTERVSPGATGSTITAADSNGYVLRHTFALVRKAGLVWHKGYEYEVAYNRGYAAGSEPADIRWAVQTIVTHWYERRVPVPKIGEVHTFPVSHHLSAVLSNWRRRPV